MTNRIKIKKSNPKKKGFWEIILARSISLPRYTQQRGSFPPRIKYGVNSIGNPEKHWIPGQAQNDKLYKTYVIMIRKPHYFPKIPVGLIRSKRIKIT